MSVRSRLLSFVVFGAGALGACAQGSSPLATNGTNDTRDLKQPSLWWSPGDGIAVFPQKVFVGVDESGVTSPAPVALSNANGPATWVSSDPSIAEASGDAAGGQIAAVGPGITNVQVLADGTSTSLFVVALTYTSSDVTAGAKEYAMFGCGGCHAGLGSPDITPSGIGKHSDEEIVRAAQEGRNPEGGVIATPHRFSVSTAIVAYLRSLPARSTTPTIDP